MAYQRRTIAKPAPFVLTVSRLARDTVASLNQSPYTRLILHLGLGCRTRDEVHIITRTQLFSELKSHCGSDHSVARQTSLGDPVVVGVATV